MRRLPRLAVPPSAAFLVAVILAVAASARGGQQVPEAADVERSLKVLRKIFADDYAKAAKAVPDRKALALTLRNEAKNAKESPPLYYATLKEAADVAAQAGYTELAFEIVADLGKAFAVSPAAVRIEVLTPMV